MDIKKLNKVELEELLFSLKFYKNVKTQLWKKWKYIFDRVYNNKSFYKVEYFPKMSEENAWKEADIAYQKSFWEKLKKEEVIFIKNEKLLWWIIILKDDNILDLSFSKISRELTS